MNAPQQWVIEGMQACLPNGVPLPFTIESASVKKGIVQAHVRIFDGQLGTLQISQIFYGTCTGWCLRWLDLPGGAINWDGERWNRVKEKGFTDAN